MNNLEDYYSDSSFDDSWNNFAKLCENIESENTKRLLELFNDDIKLVNVIEYHLGESSLDWIKRKIPAMGNKRPIDCMNNVMLLKKLKECLLQFPSH